MKKIINRVVQYLLLPCFVLAAGSLETSCSDSYGDDLRSIGARVEYLENEVFQLNSDIAALQTIVSTVEANGFITAIVHNADGSHTLYFNDGRTVVLRDGAIGKDGQNGHDGYAPDVQVSVGQDGNGKWYWTFNGEWILNSDGQKMPVTGADGKDGKDGQDGKDGADGKDGVDGKDGKDDYNPLLQIPQVRVNPETRCWEISTDGGLTWTSTLVFADGQDGKDGADGRDGYPSIFVSIDINVEEGYVLFVLIDGTTFMIPISSAAWLDTE